MGAGAGISLRAGPLARRRPAVRRRAGATGATGLQTVGYKATLLIPQNLRLTSASRRVRRGRAATLKGTLAVPSDATPGASVSWAAPGTPVTIQRKTGSRWITARVVRTAADGSWRARVRVRSATNWRAWWPGDHDIAAEYSLVKRTAVTR